MARYLWTPETGEPTGTLVNDGSGLFHGLLDTTGQVGQWVAQL